MRTLLHLIGVSVALLVATPAFAGRGGHGGDREPAGGAFMTSYPEPGSTGIQFGNSPRAAIATRTRQPIWHVETPVSSNMLGRQLLLLPDAGTLLNRGWIGEASAEDDRLRRPARPSP